MFTNVSSGFDGSVVLCDGIGIEIRYFQTFQMYSCTHIRIECIDGGAQAHVRFAQFFNVVHRIGATQLTFGAIFHVRYIFRKLDDAFQLLQRAVRH